MHAREISGGRKWFRAFPAKGTGKSGALAVSGLALDGPPFSNKAACSAVLSGQLERMHDLQIRLDLSQRLVAVCGSHTDVAVRGKTRTTYTGACMPRALRPPASASCRPSLPLQPQEMVTI